MNKQQTISEFSKSYCEKLNVYLKLRNKKWQQHTLNRNSQSKTTNFNIVEHNIIYLYQVFFLIFDFILNDTIHFCNIGTGWHNLFRYLDSSRLGKSFSKIQWPTFTNNCSVISLVDKQIIFFWKLRIRFTYRLRKRHRIYRKNINYRIKIEKTPRVPRKAYYLIK